MEALINACLFVFLICHVRAEAIVFIIKHSLSAIQHAIHAYTLIILPQFALLLLVQPSTVQSSRAAITGILTVIFVIYQALMIETSLEFSVLAPDRGRGGGSGGRRI